MTAHRLAIAPGVPGSPERAEYIDWVHGEYLRADARMWELAELLHTLEEQEPEYIAEQAREQVEREARLVEYRRSRERDAAARLAAEVAKLDPAVMVAVHAEMVARADHAGQFDGTQAELADALDVKASAVSTSIRAMVRDGKLKLVGKRKTRTVYQACPPKPGAVIDIATRMRVVDGKS